MRAPIRSGADRAGGDALPQGSPASPTSGVTATKPRGSSVPDALHDHTKQPVAPAGNTYVWIPTDAPSGGIWSLHQSAPSGGGGNGGGNGNGNGPDLTAPVGPIDHSTESGTTAINDILNGIIGFSSAQIQNFYNEYKSGLPISRIVDDIRGTPQYTQRFPGMANLVKTGNRISEGNYIAKENADRELMQNTFGASASLYNSTAQLGDLIGKNVSTAELGNRLQGYTDAVLAAPASETQWFKDQGMSQGDLTSFWLNPDITMTDIQRRANIGQLGGIAVNTGTSLNAAQANTLAAQGVTPGQAQQGFGQIGLEGQFKQQLPGEANAPVTQQDLLDATFSNDPAAQQKVNLVRQQRQAAFQEGGNMAATNQGVSGLGNANTV